MRQAGFLYVGYVLLLWLATGCATTRFVPDGDYLYKGATFAAIDTIDHGVLNAAEKKMAVRSNTSLLGVPYKLIVYNMAFGKNKGVFHKLTSSLAEPPVLLSQIDTLAMLSRLKQHLFTSGYFKPEIQTSQVKKGKAATVNYMVHAGKRYKIGEIIYPRDSSQVMNAIRSTADSSLLHPGDFIQLGALARERERINESLKNQGYFMFNPESIAYRADTIGNAGNNLYLYLKTAANEKSMQPWQIGSMVVHSSDPVTGDSLSHSIELGQHSAKAGKSLKIAGYKTQLYNHALLLKEGEIYSKKKHFLSIQRLLNLETFQFVKFSFTQHPTDSVNLLTTHLYVTPLKRYHVKFEVSAGAKGNNYLGTKLSSSLINTNVFGRAEKLQLEVQGGADVQFGGNRLGGNSLSFGSKLSLALPRLVPRFHIDGGLNPTMPETKVTLGSTFIQVPKLFSINVSGLSIDYKFRSNRKAEHELTPVDFGTFGLSRSSPIFDSVLVLVPSLRQTFRSQLVLGSSYRLWIDKPVKGKMQGGAGIKIKSSGNLLGLIAKKSGSDNPGDRKLFGLAVSQFVKLEGELRGYFKLDPANTLALRTTVGVGVAYGNSVTLPYSEQFFIGGSNSLRAFRAGTVGPGSYHSTEKVLSNIEYGDFKLEMNGEWRHAINSTVKLAAFMDAGNVWLRKEDPAKPGAGLHHMLSELALGGGLGLRFDFSLLVLRFDLATPFRKPWYEKGDRWVLNEFDLSSKSWRKQNLVLNVGIGYPF